MELILCQLDIAWEDRRTNHDRVRAMLEANPPSPGALLALPEMFNTGFSMNVAAVAEGEDRPGERFLMDLARRWRISILAGLVTDAPQGRGYNTAMLLSPEGRRLAEYRKTHLFSFAQEDRHYLAGDQVVTFRMNDFTVAPMICYDLRFPEMFRAAADRGAQVMIVLAEWPASRADHWEALLTARAIENQAYVAGVNRCGRDPLQSYGGASRIIDPQGKIVAQAGDEPVLVRGRLDLAQVERWRSKFPALRDRRRIQNEERAH